LSCHGCLRKHSDLQLKEASMERDIEINPQENLAKIIGVDYTDLEKREAGKHETRRQPLRLGPRGPAQDDDRSRHPAQSCPLWCISASIATSFLSTVTGRSGIAHEA